MSESPWTIDRAGGEIGSVTMVDGTTFLVASPSGAIFDRHTHGLFALDTRVLSLWRLGIRDRWTEHLAFVPNGSFSGTFVSRAESDGPFESSLVVVQRRHVGRGMREDISVRNHGAACELDLTMELDTDFAGLFDVKAGHLNGSSEIATLADRLIDGMVIRVEEPSPYSEFTAVDITATIVPDEIDVDRRTLTWHLSLPARGEWGTCVQVALRHGDRSIEVAHPCNTPVEDTIPVGRLRTWRDNAPTFVSEHAPLTEMIRRSVEDLGALRIFDPDHVDRVVVAAGAPWFMALFGRDSLLTSWMALPFDHALARGVLLELADNQGVRDDPRNEEQPGRILHEVRFDRLSQQVLGGSTAYYGTVDATPLFVMLAAETVKWTGVTEEAIGLLPAVDRALAWIDRFGDRDGDGFVEYLREGPTGLEHQGWKDSWDGIRDETGAVVAPPIALCEVQGYCYAAFRARAYLARATGESDDISAYWEERADELGRRFDEAFWLDDVGAYAVGLDAEKRPIRSITSNMGHLLWTGIVPQERAGSVAAHLVSPEMFSGWGIRTLSSANPGFNPLSYHCGSVWPHDTAIAVAGLARYGFDEEAQMVTQGLIDAGTVSGHLPELFGGFDRSDLAAPVPYPTACSPQAWSAAAPLLLVRSLLGLDPDVAAGRLDLRPRPAAALGPLRLSGVRVGSQRLTIALDGNGCEVTAAEDDVDVVLDVDIR